MSTRWLLLLIVCCALPAQAQQNVRVPVDGVQLSAQRAKAYGQRSRNRQPDGGLRASGTLPMIGNGARDWSASGTGTAATRARV